MTSPSQALAKRQNEMALMPPPPPPKRIKRPATVLDEDVYTQALSDIIARDYFPGLLEEQVKQEYLEALDSKDKDWIATSKKKLADLMRTPGRARGRPAPATSSFTTGRPGDTPTGWGGDTPMSVLSSTTATATATSAAADKPAPDVSKLGLLEFQAQYTSEDNESFNKLLDKQNAKRREKHAWLWAQNKIPSARQIAHRRREAKRLDSSSSSQALVPIKTDLAARPAAPDTWSAAPDNALMFMPPSIEDTHETAAQKADAASRAGPKRVVYHNTRLPDGATQTQSQTQQPPPSPSVSAIQDAIAGRPRPTDSESGYAGGETPRVNGYAFVDEDEPEPEPQPQPFSGGGDEYIPSADDLHLLAGDKTPNPFQIRDPRHREDLHHRMVDRVARKKRAERAAREIKTPVAATPRFATSPRVDFGLRQQRATPGGVGAGADAKMLTPAAQRLLQRVGRTPRVEGESGSSLRSMWTPTPTPRRR